jgi:hypothetical protein
MSPYVRSEGFRWLQRESGQALAACPAFQRSQDEAFGTAAGAVFLHCSIAPPAYLAARFLQGELRRKLAKMGLPSLVLRKSGT